MSREYWLPEMPVGGVFAFEWWRPVRCVTTGKMIRREGGVELIRPFELAPDLHRVFANLDDSGDSAAQAREFIGRFGFLGLSGADGPDIDAEDVDDFTCECPVGTPADCGC